MPLARDKRSLIATGLGLAAICALALLTTAQPMLSGGFLLGAGGTLLLLAGLGWLIQTLARRLPHFLEDVPLRPHPLVAARIRHDAERAELIAPLDDRHVRLDGIVAARDAEGKRHVFVRVDVDARRGIAIGERLADERG